jgi:hypothetical protein
LLRELVPEGGFAGGDERVFAGVPAEKMWGTGVRGVVFAGSPDFVEEKGTGVIHATVQIETKASGFLTGGHEEGAKLGFEKDVLAFLGAESDDQSDGVFGELRDSGAVSAAPGGSPGGFGGFVFRHVGGDCTPNEGNGKENRDTRLST